jgi:serine/threonine protein kinase/Tol biopolymer transport system component
LCREVEALLAHAQTGEGFLATPLEALAAGALANDRSQSLLGRSLGPYQIASQLGSGGMGEVYRARDTKLGRDVAIKVLPKAFTSDPDRLARFEREARVLATLNHPNIGAIYGLEHAGGVQALILELVEGETLACRLQRGPLPVPEMVAIAKQVADALEAAHGKGIVHRDLKPANIQITSDAVAKVLDFGLAKAASLAGDDIDITDEEGTRKGAVLGTAAYMSPEQARGQSVDKRTDLWAFGCVLYEMLMGRRAFEGANVSETLAFVLTREPDWTALPTSTPPSIRRLLRRCLAKDPRKRIHDVADARLELEAALQDAPGESPPVLRDVPSWKKDWRRLVLVGMVIGSLAFAMGRLAWPRDKRALSIAVTSMSVPVPSGVAMEGGEVPSLAISPDGSRIVFETQGRLYARALDRFTAEPIPGTDGAQQPFFSPDGAWLGFVVSKRTLMKMPAGGGPPIKVVDASFSDGLTWGPDNRIIFVAGVGTGGLSSVSAEGGTPKQVTVVRESENETAHVWPVALPDGSLLYTVLGRSLSAQDARLMVEDMANGTRTVVAEGVTYARYLASGHLLSTDANGTLLLQPFDWRRRRTTGPARPVLAGVRTGAVVGGAAYAVSLGGTLAYVTGTELESGILTEVDRAGRERRHFGSPRTFEWLSRSPDGRRLAMTIRSATNSDIYLMDIESGRFDRFTFDSAEDETPVWSPDGTKIAYSSAWVGEQRRIFIKDTATGEPERLVHTGKRHLHLYSWSPDGHWLAFEEYAPGSLDVWLIGLDDPPRLVSVATTAANERGGFFSPDGHWFVYDSDETGRFEKYAVSFPNLSAKHMLSREGSALAQWSATGAEMFFWDLPPIFGPARMMMARRARQTREPAWEDPVTLFDVPLGPSMGFAVSRDGRSFYLVKANPAHPSREIFVVVNWLQNVLSQNANAARP